MFNRFWLVILLISVSCSNPAHNTAPVAPGDNNPVIQEPDGNVEQSHNVETTISRTAYGLVVKGDSFDKFKSVITVNPVMTIPQPDSSMAYRYQILDADGKWRGRHATFIFSPANYLIRKVIS